MQDYFEDEYPVEAEEPRGLKRLLALYMRWGGAVVSVALVGLFVLWAYRLGVRDAAEIPVIRALDGPVRVQPEDPGGQVAENQGLEVNEILAGEEAQIPRETQLAPASLTLSEEDTPVAEPAPVFGNATDGVDTAALVEEVPGAVPDEETEREAASDEIGALVAAVTGDADLPPVAAEEAEPAPAVAAIGLRPLLRSDVGAAPPLTTAAATPSRAEVAPGTLLIQLGAFDSEEIAEGQWSTLLATHDDLLGARERFIQRAESNGRVFYRLRVLGFDSRNDQRALCEALGARGVDCIPVTAR